ncbi:hypothetical protein [Variovorax sp. DAIF25]
MESTSVFGEYLIWKAIGLAVIVAVGGFVYGLVTGRTLGQGRRDKDKD